MHPWALIAPTDEMIIFVFSLIQDWRSARNKLAPVGLSDSTGICDGHLSYNTVAGPSTIRFRPALFDSAPRCCCAVAWGRVRSLINAWRRQLGCSGPRDVGQKAADDLHQPHQPRRGQGAVRNGAVSCHAIPVAAPCKEGHQVPGVPDPSDRASRAGAHPPGGFGPASGRRRYRDRVWKNTRR